MPDFSALPRYAPRQWVPDRFDPSEPAQIETLYDQLAEQNLASPAALEQFLRRWSELTDAIQEVGIRCYIAMTCQTDDATAAEAYRQFVTGVAPLVKRRDNELEKMVLASPARSALPAARYAVFDREVTRRDEIYREANVALETEDELLAQEYTTLIGSLTVQFDGEERTLAQLYPVLEETDRARREAAWRAMNERRYREREKLDAILDRMIGLRETIACNAGFANFRDYKFAQLLRFDYTPADCFAFHDAVERHVVPLLRRIQAARRAQMGLGALRPWDTSADPLGRPPLRPFATARELIDGCARIFTQVDPALAAQFAQMDQRGVLDLENRKGKGPGGYQELLPESRVPFIFMNAVSTDGDVMTLLHEGGHAFNAFATQSEWLNTYRHPPMEFAEVASMSMELLGAPHIEAFYALADAQRSRTQHMESTVTVLSWIAIVDAFQHWLYTAPGHTHTERNAEWARLYARFGGEADWTGLEAYRDSMWHRQLHIFEVPFYYIEYGIAQLGALQIWRNMRQDRAAAIAAYRRALALGGSRTLPEIYATAGIEFKFDAGTVAPLMELVAKELGI
ncbi:MAG: M3 family oligoendopeptidase [Chloroflexi bacterium]|nr:M3 family oligoendopeptidase [Chloroflexota bacterium]